MVASGLSGRDSRGSNYLVFGKADGGKGRPARCQMERTSFGFQLLSAGEIVMGEQTEYLAFVKHSILFKKATAIKVSYWQLAMTYSDGQGRY